MMQNDNVDMEAHARLHPAHFQQLYQPGGVTIHLCLCTCLFCVLMHPHRCGAPQGMIGGTGLVNETKKTGYHPGTGMAASFGKKKAMGKSPHSEASEAISAFPGGSGKMAHSEHSTHPANSKPKIRALRISSQPLLPSS